MNLETFKKQFENLDSTEQDFLKILSIAYEPISSTNMKTLLNRSGLTKNRRVYTTIVVKEYKNMLSSLKWIELDEKSRMTCQKAYEEMIMRIAVTDDRFDFFVERIRQIMPAKDWLRPRSFDVCLRELRLSLYQDDSETFNTIMQDIQRYYGREWNNSSFYENFFLPFDPESFDLFSPTVQTSAISFLLFEHINKLKPIDAFISFIEGKVNIGGEERSSFTPFLNSGYLFLGALEKSERLLSNSDDSSDFYVRKAMIEFMKGDYKKALLEYKVAIRLARKETGDKKFQFLGIEGIFYCLTLLSFKGTEEVQALNTFFKAAEESPFYIIMTCLHRVALFQQNRLDGLEQEVPETGLDWLFYGLSKYWNQEGLANQEIAAIEKYYSLADRNNYHWIKMELAGVLSKLSKTDNLKKRYEKIWSEQEKELQLKSILPLVVVQSKWERSLQGLLQINKKGRKKVEGKQTRLIWLVDFEEKFLQPKEQSLNKSGAWSKGRNIALKRLKEGGVKCMMPQDLQVAKAVEAYNTGGWGYYNKVDYEINFEKAVPALVDHPFLFLNDAPNVSVELTKKTPELTVEENDDGFVLKFTEEFDTPGKYLVKETPTRYALMEISDALYEVNRLIEGGNLQVPRKAKKQLIEAIENVASVVTVQSVIGENTKNIPKVKADARTCVHLLPIGDGFKIEFFVKPFKSDPPYFKPGSGRTNVMAEIGGERKQTKRNLELEKTNAEEVEAACPSFKKVEAFNGEWSFDELEDCLNVLLELEPLRKEKKIILEHPKGEKLRIVGEVDFDSLSLSIEKDNDWFGITGKTKVDGKKVLDFRQLLDSLDNDSRYIELSEGKFLAITEQLQRKLKELNSLLTKNKKDMKFHPLATPVLEDFAGLIDDLKVDAGWKDQVNRLKKARAVNPKVPSTFKAELRSYQQEGYRWLSQLAEWGVGACLADDMGLGKTIQGLAVLVNRAKKGAALVVAPASVARNWMSEARKFAPTLNAILFGAGDRKEIVENLKPFDLLVCSYGLMQSEEELLTSHEFATIILDEAQAIKNRATKRSKTAMNLKADFKIATTGTPIENHLGEIWNLFNFLNPGLLGSLQKFNTNYAYPIEKGKNKEVSQQLRRLIQPFILRRHKSEVLDELPAKTEITLTVEFSDEERAFYEALRQKAIESIEGTEEGGKQRFQILAELMRLRQACCNPKLVVKNSKIPSSKQDLLATTIEELIANGHKALIFSQFVKHLKLVEEWVKSKGISYQYLDGQTPLKKREQRINAFQAGEGELFLISLKAGGTGLNLTAADYVIHLDPWWNPAVEDQASDRAHRIGQKRPVTIYRLVTENTIEEKIVKLHGEKRDLADSLLEGTETSAKLSAKELLNLIKGD